MKNFFKKLLAGVGIGVGAAVPGVSGAAIAVIFKIYEDIINSINFLFKKFKESIRTLLPVLLGIIIAVIPCIWLFDKALNYFLFATMCIFAGFLIGSIPSVQSEIKEEKFTKNRKIALICGVFVVILIGVGSVLIGQQINLDSIFQQHPAWLFAVLIPVGFIAAVALTIPGLSGSLILLLIGFYKPLVHYVVEWAKSNQWGTLFCAIGSFALGVVLGIVLISKVMGKLIEKHRAITYFAIFGFIIGSIGVLFFNSDIFKYYISWSNGTQIGLKPYIEILIGLGAGILAFIISRYLIKKSLKNN